MSADTGAPSPPKELFGPPTSPTGALLARVPIPDQQPSWVGFALALGTSAIAVLALLLPGSHVDSHPTAVLLVLPVLFGAYVGGLWPGLLATTLVALAYPFAPLLLHGPHAADAVTTANEAALIVAGVLLSAGFEALHRARRDSDARCATMVRVAPVGMFMSRATDGCLLGVSAAFADILGYPREELIGRTSRELGLWVDYEMREAMGRLMQEHGRVANYELRLRRKTGESVTITGSAEFLRYRGERCVLGTMMDVSDRKRTEASLAAAESMFRGLVEQSLAGIYIIQDDRFRYVNSGFVRMYGYDSAADIVDRIPIGDVVAPHDRARVAENVRRRTAGEASDMHYEFDALRRDGSIMPVEVHGRVFEYGGRPAVIGIALDVTERKTLEADVRRDQQHLETLVAERTAALHRAHTMAHVDSWKLDIVNGMFSYLQDGSPNIGLNAQSLSWDNLIARIHPDDRPGMLAAWSDALAGRRAYDIEHRMIVNGEVRWIHAKAEIEHDAGGRAVRATGMTQDITDRRLLEDALRESEARHRVIMESAEDAVFITDKAGRYLYANSAALRTLGYTLAELQALTVRDLVERTELTRFPKHMRNIRRGERHLLDWHLRHKNGSAILFELTTTQLPDRRYLAIGRDATARRAAEEQLRIAASVFANATEGILITDAAGTILDVNGAFTDLTGYARDEAIGQNPRILKSGHHDAAFYSAMWRSLLDTGQWHGEIWNRRKSGALFACRTAISAARDHAGNIHRFMGIFSDVTEVKRHQEAVEHLAYYDSLTQLPNRALLADRMQQALARAARNDTAVAVCYLDLDGFKQVNDRHGHKTGDLLLVEIAGRLKSCVRAQDTVARLGGDEFVLLLTDLDDQQTWCRILERALGVVVEPSLAADVDPIAVSASIGVTVYPDDLSVPDTLLRHADMAMYQAKQAGGNRVHVFALRAP